MGKKEGGRSESPWIAAMFSGSSRRQEALNFAFLRAQRKDRAPVGCRCAFNAPAPSCVAADVRRLRFFRVAGVMAERAVEEERMEPPHVGCYGGW